MQNEQTARELKTAATWLKWSKWLAYPTIILVTAALYGAFIFAPTERQMCIRDRFKPSIKKLDLIENY